MLKKLSDESWLLFAKLDPKYLEENIFEELWNIHPEKLGSVLIYGKYIDTPRYHASFEESYNFSGQTLEKEVNTPDILLELKYMMETYRNQKYDQILLNWYRNGHDYIGRHSDDERQLKNGSEIVSISLGATRKFRIRDKKTKAIVYDVDIENGNIVIMGGKIQKEFTHEIVKVAGKKGALVGRRINITFRIWK